MAWPAIIGAAVGVAGLISSFVGAKKASKAAKEAAAEEARLEGLVTDEKIRQLGIDERTMFGETTARYAGSGVQAFAPSLGGSQVQDSTPAIASTPQSTQVPVGGGLFRTVINAGASKTTSNQAIPMPSRSLRGGASGSVASVLQEQASAFADQKRITEQVGATKAQMALTRGRNLADQYRYSGYANVASGISSILTNYQLTK